MAKFNNILGTIGHTPVVKINKLAPAGINLYVKIEAFNPLGSVKDRLRSGHRSGEKSGELKVGHTCDPGDFRQYRHWSRDGLCGQGLSARCYNGGKLFS